MPPVLLPEAKARRLGRLIRATCNHPDPAVQAELLAACDLLDPQPKETRP